MYEYNAVITNVVDGDTFDMDIDLGFHIHIHERVRLLGVDTPETTARVSEEDKRAGLAVKHWAKMRLEGERCVIRTKETDSFGRWLAEIDLTDINIDMATWYTDLGINKRDAGYSVDNCFGLTGFDNRSHR